nr:unnamed protein product [Callosobruchus analis]
MDLCAAKWRMSLDNSSFGEDEKIESNPENHLQALTRAQIQIMTEVPRQQPQAKNNLPPVVILNTQKSKYERVIISVEDRCGYEHVHSPLDTFRLFKYDQVMNLMVETVAIQSEKQLTFKVRCYAHFTSTRFFLQCNKKALRHTRFIKRDDQHVIVVDLLNKNDQFQPSTPPDRYRKKYWDL